VFAANRVSLSSYDGDADASSLGPPGAAAGQERV
jgi:hypothetical protein